MSAPLLWSLIACGLGVVVVRRRSLAVGLLAAQSAILGVTAIVQASGVSTELLVAAGILLAKALVLPAILIVVIGGTREPARIVSEPPALGRLLAAIAVALLIVYLAPPIGLPHPAVESAAVGLVALGIVTVALRGAALLQALGFLLAENGLYLAAIDARGGLPALIEIGLVFDLVVIVSVAAAFGAKIHEELGTGDTTLLRGLRD